LQFFSSSYKDLDYSPDSEQDKKKTGGSTVLSSSVGSIYILTLYAIYNTYIVPLLTYLNKMHTLSFDVGKGLKYSIHHES
jgi:hypothetical protein